MAKICQMLVVVIAATILSACTDAPPVAKRVDHPLTVHGETRNDPYYWLRDDSRSNPEMLAYLQAENQYTQQVLKPAQSIKQRLYDQAISRLPAQTESLAYTENGCEYQYVYAEDADYASLAQRCPSMPERVLVNFDERGKGHDYFDYADVSVSPNKQYVAWLEDHEGRRQNQIMVKRLDTGAVRVLPQSNLGYGLVWSTDSRSLFAVEREQGTLREHRVIRVALGTGEATQVFHEPDEQFALYLSKTMSGRFLVIQAEQTEQTNLHLVDLSSTDFKAVVFTEPKESHRYLIDHINDQFYVISNVDAPNGQLFKVAEADHAAIDRWRLLVEHRDDATVEAITIFNKALFTLERARGVRQIMHRDLDGQLIAAVPKPNTADTIGFGTNLNVSADHLVVQVEGLALPTTYVAYNWQDQSVSTLKQDEVDNIDLSQYQVEQRWVEARDGAEVLVSLVRHKDTAVDGTAPLWLYGYGSYGSSLDSWFSVSRTVLLDEGFVWAIAHVRGGAELGKAWYEQGKLFNKKNSFTDFIDVTQGLINLGYADATRVYAEGASAGGLLMGGVINLEPELYRGVIAGVPFVDVVTTMLDPTIPLTTFEWQEWGNPINKPEYDYMLSYSPYDQVAGLNYPNLLVTSGLHDSQVQYYEPTKWVAKMRHHWVSPNKLMLKTNMAAGHGGSAGRYGALLDELEEMAFIMAVDQKLL